MKFSFLFTVQLIGLFKPLIVYSCFWGCVERKFNISVHTLSFSGIFAFFLFAVIVMSTMNNNSSPIMSLNQTLELNDSLAMPYGGQQVLGFKNYVVNTTLEKSVVRLEGLEDIDYSDKYVILSCHNGLCEVTPLRYFNVHVVKLNETSTIVIFQQVAYSDVVRVQIPGELVVPDSQSVFSINFTVENPYKVTVPYAISILRPGYVVNEGELSGELLPYEKKVIKVKFILSGSELETKIPVLVNGKEYDVVVKKVPIYHIDVRNVSLLEDKVMIPVIVSHKGMLEVYYAERTFVFKVDKGANMVTLPLLSLNRSQVVKIVYNNITVVREFNVESVSPFIVGVTDYLLEYPYENETLLTIYNPLNRDVTAEISVLSNVPSVYEKNVVVPAKSEVSVPIEFEISSIVTTDVLIKVKIDNKVYTRTVMITTDVSSFRFSVDAKFEDNVLHLWITNLLRAGVDNVDVNIEITAINKDSTYMIDDKVYRLSFSPKETIEIVKRVDADSVYLNVEIYIDGILIDKFGILPRVSPDKV